MRTSRLLSAYLARLFRLQRGSVGLALVLMISLSLTEGVGLLTLVPLLELVGLDSPHGSVSAISRLFSSFFATLNVRPSLAKILALYILITLLHGLLRRRLSLTNVAIQAAFVTDLRSRLYTALARSNWLFFSRRRASDFTHVLTAEVERTGGAAHQLLLLLSSAAVLLVYVLFAIQLSAAAAALALLCGLVLILLTKHKNRRARALGQGLSRTTGAVYAAIDDLISGMKTVKCYGAEDRHARAFGRLSRDVQHVYQQAVRNRAQVRYWFDVGAVLILSVISYATLEVLTLSSTELLLVVFLAARIIPRLTAMQQTYHSILSLAPAYAAIRDLQGRCEAAAEIPTSGQGPKITLQHAIRLENVSFAYDRTQAIHQLDLTIPAYQTVAIVGPSGSGKTTLADLIMGLISPNQGRVLIDEAPLSESNTQQWRRQVGYVAQDAFLFHDTIRANLSWARQDATESDLREALRWAAAEEFVDRQPEGLDAQVGDRSIRLSAGERQRLALARALLRQPDLLILDEATSNLDSENERRVQEAIEHLHGRATILVISHRFSTLRGADLVYVVERGRVIESGPWESLWNRKESRFRSLFRAQNPGDLSQPLDRALVT